MKRIRIEIEGIVQGVGFRPFLHRLAARYGITGWVRNTSAGLEGELQGSSEALGLFLRELQDSPPPMALVENIKTENAASESDCGSTFSRFTIRQSHIRPGVTLVSPDIAMCPECEAELHNPADRRYRYPFINCTNCGPRYTIIHSLPYDRERTVMNEFPMCGDCSDEYNKISSRRYHAQPDCCPVCGPQVFFYRNTGTPASDPGNMESVTGNDAFLYSRNLLADGGILAVKGIGGIHLACDARNYDAVMRLRRRKHRPEKPLAVMCRSIDDVRRICSVTPAEEQLLSGPQRPIVLLSKRKDISDTALSRALDALSFSSRLGVMLPYTPLHTLLLDGTESRLSILVMTSGNLSGCPVLTDNREALLALASTADGFLLHNRKIANRCDDSLIMEWKNRPYFLRRSRGYAPSPVTLNLRDEHCDGIFAMGAEQKASFAFGRGRHIFLSPYIGDLKNAETYNHYTETIRTYRELFHLSPSLCVCDLHPDYLSTSEARHLAAEEGASFLQVQHHWAHMVSCMADNGLRESCFGIIWDGTGLGTDGTVWGGEFLNGSAVSYRRCGSIRPVPLAGGDRAIHEIGRIALALVYDAFGQNDSELSKMLPLVSLEEKKKASLVRLLDTSWNSLPSASSIGRLFDGICALITGRTEVTYDGEAAALTEALSPFETPDEAAASHGNSCLSADPYSTVFYEKDGIRFFDTRPMIREILNDLTHGKGAGQTALRFMTTLIHAAADQCRTLNPEKLPVVLSGGVFQNRFLLHGITAALSDLGYRVYTHHNVSTNDEGICLGQLAIAAEKRSKNHVSGNTYENK